MEAGNGIAQTPSKASRSAKSNDGTEIVWPFKSASYERYERLSSANKQVLESLVSTFIDSCFSRSKS
jgi:hypothetical protein